MQKQGIQINDQELTRGRQAESTLSAVQDICQPEASAIESEKLKLAGLLAGSITHDLNNPLCGVHSVLERFARKSDLADTEQYLLQLALQQCEQMKLLLRDVQEFIHASSHEQSLFDLGPVVKTVLRLVHKQLKLSQIVVHPLIGQEPIMLMGCKDQIKLMLLQLFVAVCRKLDGSRCEIALKAQPERKWLRLMWQFQGPQEGTAGRLKHLLAELTQTDCILDRGVGMAHAILELHGGTIHLSASAQGPEVMVLSLPIEQNAHENERGSCGAGSRTDSR